MMSITILALISAIITWLLIRYWGVKCPDCGNRMKMTECTDTTNVWACIKCNRRVIIEEV